MFLALRELTFARGRFTLMGIVIALISVLVVLLSGLSSGLVNDDVSGLKSMPATAFAFNAGTITDNAFSRSLHQDREKIVVQCEGLDHEPSEFGITVVGATGPSDALYFDALSYMSAEDFVALAESYSVHIDETLDSAGTDYRSTFGANVAGTIREQCAILRERQQTGVIVAYGQGLLLLALAGLAALITTPRQRAAARATSAE